MTRAAVTKLLLLVILAFIICLPEFFSLYRESKVNFLCLPYEPCERGDQVKEGEHGKTGNAEIKREDVCKPSQTQWDQACTQESHSNATDSASDYRRSRDDPKMSWFMCKTDMDLTELQRNTSSTATKLHLEVSVELQLSDAETLNLTLYGRSNHSSLHLYPPEGEEEEEEQKGDDEGQREAFFCCLPLLPTSQTANQSRCLLWLANQTVLTATAKEKLPWKRTQKDEWRCMFRVLWLTLLCVVFLAIVAVVIGQIYWGKCLCKKPKVCPVFCNSTGHHSNGKQAKGGGKQTETITPKATVLHSYGFQGWSGLSTIEEADSQNDIEMLLDGNVDLCYTANLHHRGHPSTSCLTEDQAW